jgi:hypothetical protein
MAEGGYTRIYWQLAAEYPDVWADDHALALYVRLLTGAEQWYPSDAPRTLMRRSRAAYALLVRHGLVIETAHACYTCAGLAKERAARSARARYAAGMRWASAPDAKTRRDETRRDGEHAHRIPGPGEAALPVHDGRHGRGCLVCYPAARK